MRRAEELAEKEGVDDGNVDSRYQGRRELSAVLRRIRAAIRRADGALPESEVGLSPSANPIRTDFFLAEYVVEIRYGNPVVDILQGNRCSGASDGARVLYTAPILGGFHSFSCASSRSLTLRTATRIDTW